MPPVERRDDISCPKCGHEGVYVQAHMDVLCRNDNCDWTGIITEYDESTGTWPDEESPDSDEMLALNELTGLVHDYAGAGLGRPLDCGCGLGDEELDALVMIRRKHMERGIWRPAPCLGGDTDAR
jgi:hypothetical protein